MSNNINITISQNSSCDCSSANNEKPQGKEENKSANNKTVTIPNGVTTINKNMFKTCCKWLESIIIPDSVTSIEDDTFLGCSKLTNITYTGDLKSWCEMKGLINLMSYGARNKTLTINRIEITGVLIIPDGVTTIGSSTFSHCSNLTSVTIGNSVTTIGSTAFYDCSKLATIKFAGTAAQWNAISKGSGWKLNVPATKVVCSNGSVTL